MYDQTRMNTRCSGRCLFGREGRMNFSGRYIKLSFNEAKQIKNLLLSHRDSKQIEYDNRLAYGANPKGSEMIYLQVEIDTTIQLYRSIVRKLEKEQ